MQFYWCQDLVSQKYLYVYWNSGKFNLGYYYSKQHAARHQQTIRLTFIHDKPCPGKFLQIIPLVCKGMYIRIVIRINITLTLILYYNFIPWNYRVGEAC